MSDVEEVAGGWDTEHHGRPEQMPEAEKELNAYEEKGEQELKILQTTGREKVF